MDIREIDKNFDTTFVAPEDIEWFSVQNLPFSIHGVVYSEEGYYRRMPKEIAEQISVGVEHLSKNTAGGRVRFATDSPYIAIRVEELFDEPFSHMTIAGKSGVSLFADKSFIGTIMPSYQQIITADTSLGGNGIIEFDGIKYPYMVDREVYQVEIVLPLYSIVKNIYVGLQKGCSLQEAKPYKHTSPILFYGSSITQGGCASKPGDDYINRLSRMLDTEVVNLGFSGSALAEPAMAEYIANQNASIFVLDYDHNAPTAEHLQKTHFALYEIVRKANPTTPIIIMTMPAMGGYEKRPFFKSRIEEILKSYERAKELGDKNVYFIDCYGCFGDSKNGESGTVDDCHPNSLGFLRMTERIYPLLNKLLNGER